MPVTLRTPGGRAIGLAFCAECTADITPPLVAAAARAGIAIQRSGNHIAREAGLELAAPEGDQDCAARHASGRPDAPHGAGYRAEG